MSVEKILNRAVSSWMLEEGPCSDIVLSTRIRLARNIEKFKFPSVFFNEEADEIVSIVEKIKDEIESFSLLKMNELQSIEKKVLVEKHLISPVLAEASINGACLLSENENVSMMVNEEDHIRIQCLFPGLQLKEALHASNELDDWLEQRVDYAFDERLGYLTSCPTNVGTGLRASVMMHLPGLVITNQLKQMIPAINQLGLVVRGIYGEDSEALGNIFQISNQLTLGKSEIDILEHLEGIVQQIITQERLAREVLVKTLHIQLEDRIFRSYGLLQNCRVIESKEAAKCLSDLRLGIDLGYIEGVSKNILSELMILTQPGFLQQYTKEALPPHLRDVKRATLIRERLCENYIEKEM